MSNLIILKTLKKVLNIYLNDGAYAEACIKFRFGICDNVSSVLYFNPEETEIVKQYLNKHLPNDIFTWGHAPFKWAYDNPKPRIKWLKKHIKRLERQV